MTNQKRKQSYLLYIAPKRTKYLGKNLTKEVKDLYTENYETLPKEIKDRNKWKDLTLMDWKT